MNTEVLMQTSLEQGHKNNIGQKKTCSVDVEYCLAKNVKGTCDATVCVLVNNKRLHNKYKIISILACSVD